MLNSTKAFEQCIKLLQKFVTVLFLINFPVHPQNYKGKTCLNGPCR